MTDFYDAVTPANIPDRASACLYWDGEYKATQQQAGRFARTRWITVLGGASAAAHAGCADYEEGNPVYGQPGALRAWAGARQAMGKRARIYCSRDNAAKAEAEVAGLKRLWWIATLDGIRRTPAELAADLKADFGVTIPEADLWGHQYQGGVHALYDVSELYGEW